MRALLQKIIGWVTDLFRADTLVIDGDILLPKQSGKAIPRVDTQEHWERLFSRLDEVIAVEKIARHDETGEMIASQRAFRRRVGTYIYSGCLTEFEPRVTHIKEFGLPSMVSVSAGTSLDALISGAGRRTLLLVKVTGLKVDRKNIPVDRHAGALYEASFLYAASARKKRWGGVSKRCAISGGMFFSVEEDGSVRALKYQGRHSSLATELARFHRCPIAEMTAELAGDFARAINSYRMRDSNWLVKVEDTKGGVVRATFGISPLDAPGIFNERLKVKTASGRTRPIFHPVRTHERVRENGEVSVVRLHHRGLAKFNWRGFRCEIAIPSWNGKRVRQAATPVTNDLTLTAMTFGKHEIRPPAYSSVEIAEKLLWPGSDRNQIRKNGGVE